MNFLVQNFKLKLFVEISRQTLDVYFHRVLVLLGSHFSSKVIKIDSEFVLTVCSSFMSSFIVKVNGREVSYP